MLSFDLLPEEWRAMCALPVVPAETPAIADGTSQPWTPPTEGGGILSRWPKYELGAAELRAQRDALTERVAELEAEAGRLTRERDEALAGAHAQKWNADRVENDLRAELADYRVALRDSGLWPAAEAHDVTPDRIGPRLAALRADRRFELVKAAMAGGRDGYTAVRDADEALGAMGGTKGGGS